MVLHGSGKAGPKGHPGPIPGLGVMIFIFLDVDIIKLIRYKELINVPGNYHSIVFFHLAKAKNTDLRTSEGVDISKAKFLSIDEIKNPNHSKLWGIL